jgi:hypothetical protein
MSDPTPPAGWPQYPQYPQQPQGQPPQYQQPPQYGQQQPYGQQGYQPQPLYAQPVFEPPKKSRAGLWIGLSVAALLLCCGGGVAIFFVANRLGNNVADEKSPTVPRTPVGEHSSQAQAHYTVTAPDQLGNRKKITDAEHNQLVEQVTSSMESDTKVEHAAVGYYGTPDPKVDKVYLAAITTRVAMTQSQFEDTFEGMVTAAGLEKMTDVVDANAGPLGGSARCGNLKIQGMPVAACGWSDDGTFGVIMWYNRALSQVQSEFIGLRGEVEKKA